uniref:G-protein coupled receptors family 1 profile domain-containing protein n=1 Tax=Timema shepardi TaxID=629360 RepID=A0A7R9FZZ0_TIMSH|nr:unnamed protein product [Timema shepardi]
MVLAYLLVSYCNGACAPGYHLPQRVSRLGAEWMQSPREFKELEIEGVESNGAVDIQQELGGETSWGCGQSLKGNRRLRLLAEDAFYGLKILNDLDLSQTAITYLPTGGLEDLDTLRIKETESLKIIPSVYSFKAYLAKIEEYCSGQEYDDTGQRHSQGQQRVNRHRRRGKQRQQVSEGITALYTPFLTPTSDQWDPFLKEESQSFGPLSDQEWDKAKEETWMEMTDSDESRDHNPEDGGVFHQTTATLTATKLHALCGNLSVSSTSVHCRPEPNPFNPCEDIMGYTWLRVSVWFVVVTACFGNLAVLLVLLSRTMDVSVPKFLMCHLAFADLCMGVYMLILASMDLHSSSVYFNYAYDWQIGKGCQVAGFITVFASQLSIFTLTILTLERWFAITYAIYLNKRLKLSTAAQIMAGGWTYSLVMAALPLFGISSYSTTSICLPLEVRDVTDVSYLVCLLLMNSLAFLVIAVCYIQIYLSLGQETRRPSHSTKGEMTVAKKMALLVSFGFRVIPRNNDGTLPVIRNIRNPSTHNLSSNTVASYLSTSLVIPSTPADFDILQ